MLAAAARPRGRAPRRRQADLDRGRRVLAARHRRAPTTGRQHTKTTIVIARPRRRARAARLLPQRRLLRARGRGLRRRRSAWACRPIPSSCRSSPSSCGSTASCAARCRAASRCRARCSPNIAPPADATNPIGAFAARFRAICPMLQDKGLAHYHAWAFATVRQLGAAAELMRCTCAGSPGAARPSRPTPGNSPGVRGHNLDRREVVHPEGRARGQRQEGVRPHRDLRGLGEGVGPRQSTALELID